ncbi:MAG: hypothetical protein P4L83_25550 [Nevskia sp.]|nr:hypothetical protein [Nevskia sp.]
MESSIRRRRRRVMHTAAVLLLSAVAAREACAGVVVGTRVETAVASLADTPDVIETNVSLYEPLPATAGPHPAACDWISYLRFRHVDGPADSSSADTIFAAQPGFLGGAASFDILARDVVQKSAAAGRHVEVWVNSRRSNCLVDHTGLDAAAAARDYHVALDYYYKGKVIGGHKFAGFPNWRQAKFLKAVDQGRTARDWYDLIVQGVPDPAVRARKLLCGGHSMGGPITGVFAAWGFGSDPHDLADAGYQQCAGFFAVDSTATSDPVNLAAKPGLGGLAGAIGGGIDDATHALVGFGAIPDIDLGFVITPETFNVLAIAGIAAYFQPEQESDLLRSLPHNPNLDLTLPLLLSRTYAQFLSGYPDVRSFRYTNEALLGAILDNNSQPIALIQFSAGSFGGGPVDVKDFPLPEQVGGIPVIGPLIAKVLTPGAFAKVGPTDPNVLYTWNNYDATPGTLRNGSAYTSREQEVVDMHQLARITFEGPATLMEPYFPTETLIGVFSALAESRTHSGNDADLLFPDGILGKPRGWVFAGDGGVYTALNFADPFLAILNPNAPLVPSTAPVMPDYTHIDMVSAAPVQNDGKPEGVSQYLTDFAIQTIH